MQKKVGKKYNEKNETNMQNETVYSVAIEYPDDAKKLALLPIDELGPTWGNNWKGFGKLIRKFLS